MAPPSLQGPRGRADPSWASTRPAAVIAFYRESAALKSAKKLQQPTRPGTAGAETGKTPRDVSRSSESCEASDGCSRRGAVGVTCSTASWHSRTGANSPSTLWNYCPQFVPVANSLPFCPRLRRVILDRSQALGFTSLIRAVASTSNKSTVPVDTNKSSARACLYLGCITSTTIPVTMSMKTIWRLGGNLTCADRLVTTNLTMVIDKLPSLAS